MLSVDVHGTGMYVQELTTNKYQVYHIMAN